MGGENYLNLTCRCGHSVLMLRSEIPASWEPGTYGEVSESALARMRCSRCGRVGAPDVRVGWKSLPDPLVGISK